MVHICLKSSELVEPSSHIVDTLFVVGTVKGYQDHFSWLCDDVLKVLMDDSSSPEVKEEEGDAKKLKVIAHEQEYLQAILSTLQPSSDAGTSTECWFPRRQGEIKPLKVVLAVLPSVVSRHNSPGQPHVTTSLLKKHVRPKETVVIAPLCESSEYMYSAVCAIARVGGAMMYSRKSGAGAGGVSGSSPAPVIGGIDLKETSLPSIHLTRVVFPYAVDKKMQEEFAILALGIQLTRRLVDAPCNELHTKAFTEQALEAIEGLEHVKSRVISGRDLEQKGFGGLYNVGKAAEHPPAMVILIYEPPDVKDRKSIVLVGKGVVFDTGGTQIKTKAGMPGMKRDMGGAAAVLSGFLSVARSEMALSRPLHAILCLAENSVASNAMRPDDIITMYSGKTVEINNTDAEGRLVLGDGVASAIQHLNPEVIIDMATLTGAQGIATGKYFGAIYCNDEGLEEVALQAGRESGDLCHPVPYAPEFFRSEFSSSVADMKNSVADRSNAQVSCAGQFIANHMGDYLETGGKWMHIDMAYCCYDKKDERATGWGVALLYSLIQKLNSSYS